jgi:hypothetical protein
LLPKQGWTFDLTSKINNLGEHVCHSSLNSLAVSLCPQSFVARVINLAKEISNILTSKGMTPLQHQQ